MEFLQVDVLLKDDEYRDVLIANDQLSLERKKGNVFNGFQEGAISFNPTYKYHKVLSSLLLFIMACRHSFRMSGMQVLAEWGLVFPESS